MKITDIRIDGFGIWTDLSVRELAGDVTVFHGPNEAGKTTLMQFMRAVLYGFSKERRARYLPPVHGGRPGGALRLATLRGDFEVVRRMVALDAEESLGDVTLLDEDGNAQGSHQLSSLLGGVDESIFTNVFAIGLREIQELGTLNDSAAADHLYKLTSGLDRVSLIDVVRQLADSRREILPADDRPSRLAKLLAQREKLRNEIEEWATRGRRWPQLMAERAERSREIEQVELGMAELQRQIQQYDTLLQVREKWQARRAVDEQLALFGSAADLPPDTLEQLEHFNNEIKAYRRRLHAARKQRSALREELSRHVYQRTVIGQASRIQALGEHAPWIGSLEEEVARLQNEVATLEREVEARRPQLEGPGGASRGKLPDLTPKTLALLRTPAGRMNHFQKLVERTQAEAQSVKNRTEQAMQRVTSELADLDESSLAAALEKTGVRVAQLRRRIQVEERLEQLQLQRSELDGQSQELFDWQVMPFEKMVWLFGAFVLSTVMILGGVFGGVLWGFDWFFGLLLTFFGFVGLGAAIVWKLDWERNSERQLQSCERQLELLDQQLEEAQAERDQLDQQLPQGGGPLDTRLATAERQLAHLEQLAPMDAQRHESGQHVETVERRASKAIEELKEAKKNWQVALRAAGLPEQLSPNDVRQLVRGFRAVLVVRKQLNQRRDELETRRRELASLAGRIQELFVELALTPESDSAQAQLKQLAATLAEQQNVLERRRDTARQLKQLKGRWLRAVKGYEAAVKGRRALLAKAEAADETQLRQMFAKQHQALVLRGQRDELTQSIQLAVGEHWLEEAMHREFTARGEEVPEQKRARLTERLQQSRGELTRLHEERGQLGAEMKAMVAERRMDVARLELGVVEQQIEEAIERWQILSLTGLLLESVRSIYESTRQPETLREASTFLQRLTQGQYLRVWTPIEDKVLRVDDNQGRSLGLDKLSSGTREAVFLSLRLALVAGYARRGASLPLILDDVLVNFDTARVQAAARVLCEFARQGHQLMMFTCHEHILRIFQEAGAEARLLPNREGGQREDIPVLPLAAAPAVTTPMPVAAFEPQSVEEAPMPAPRTAATADDERGKRRRLDTKRERRLERRRAAAAETPVASVAEPIEEETAEPIASAPPASESELPIVERAITERAIEPPPPRPAAPRVEPDEYRLADEEPLQRSRRLNPLPFLHAKEPIDDEGLGDESQDDAFARRQQDREFAVEARATGAPVTPPQPISGSSAVSFGAGKEFASDPAVSGPVANDESQKAKSNRRPPPERRFTWESPEMYWRDRDREALV